MIFVFTIGWCQQNDKYHVCLTLVLSGPRTICHCGQFDTAHFLSESSPHPWLSSCSLSSSLPPPGNVGRVWVWEVSVGRHGGASNIPRGVQVGHLGDNHTLNWYNSWTLFVNNQLIMQDFDHGNFFTMIRWWFICLRVPSVIDKSLDLEISREEMTPYFLARSRKLNFHFSFSSQFSRFLEKNSISLLDLWYF